MKVIHYCIITSLCLITGTLQSQNIKTIKVKPQGVYASIRIEDQNRTMQQLYDPTKRSATVDTIFNDITAYNPPVLYLFCQALFYGGEKKEAVEWYYFAQLQARFDAEICADNSAKQGIFILEENIQPVLGDYIKNNPDISKQSSIKALNLFDKIECTYDRRWINLHGMGAFDGAFGDSVPTNTKLSVDLVFWPSLKKKLIEKFRKEHL